MEQNESIIRLSVIIPVWNECETIISTLDDLARCQEIESCEVIVVDGHPEKTTHGVILQKKISRWPFALKCIESPAGRAVQMNSGLACAQGKSILFLHADTLLPEDGVPALQRALRVKDVVGGAFDFEFYLGHGADEDEIGPCSLRCMAYFARVRSRIERVPYGDQVHFFRTEELRHMGGYAEIPIMEDVEIMERLKKMRKPIIILPQVVKTSARRYFREGKVRRIVKNWFMRIAYKFGASPEKLVKIYQRY